MAEKAGTLLRNVDDITWMSLRVDEHPIGFHVQWRKSMDIAS